VTTTGCGPEVTLGATVKLTCVTPTSHGFPAKVTSAWTPPTVTVSGTREDDSKRLAGVVRGTKKAARRAALRVRVREPARRVPGRGKIVRPCRLQSGPRRSRELERARANWRGRGSAARADRSGFSYSRPFLEQFARGFGGRGCIHQIGRLVFRTRRLGADNVRCGARSLVG
jgi:hypothetical protein